MMPDNHAENATSEIERDELVARIGAIFTTKGLSPPSP